MSESEHRTRSSSPSWLSIFHVCSGPLSLLSAQRVTDEAHQLLSLLLDLLPDCHIFIKDRQSRFVVTNAAHLAVLGMQKLEDVVGKTDSDFFPENLASRYYADEQEVMLSGNPLLDRIEKVRGHGDREMWFLTTKLPVRDMNGEIIGLLGMSRNITQLKEAEDEKERLLTDLQSSLGKIKKLSGLLPICANCKKIRDDAGYWKRIEEYIQTHSEALFSHGICPDCALKLYPKLYEKKPR